MSFNIAQFNAAAVDTESNSYDPIPVGDYTAIINGAEFKPNKAGTGTNLCLEIEVVGPTHQGRKIWEYLAVDNPNPDASRIAQEKLAKIIKALGKNAVQSELELMNQPLGIKVKIRPPANGYDASNEVKDFFPVNGQAVQQAAPQQQAAAVNNPTNPAQAAPAAGKSAPWAK